MKINPNSNWRWCFETEENKLILHCGKSTPLVSLFPATMLNPDAYIEQIFTLDDTRIYNSFLENCVRLTLSKSEREHLILNGIVASRFLKPLLPKSWYFAVQSEELFSVEEGDIVAVTLQENYNNALLMVVDSGINASLCVVAQKEIVLSDKTLKLGDVLKVMNNRFMEVVFNENAVSDTTSIPYSEAI